MYRRRTSLATDDSLPVIVGTHYQFLRLAAAYNEGTTDHFVLIVGKDTGTYTNDDGETV